MGILPKSLKLTKHARERLEERKKTDIYYDTKNLMRSSCKWYTKDDLIKNSNLYLHCLYVCRKSNQMGWITNGEIEALYNKNTGIVITMMEVKEKFLPITQYIRPQVLKEIEIKKEKIKMEKENKLCVDCGKEGKLTRTGVCERCARRKANMKARGKEYIRYLDLPEEEKAKIDRAIEGQLKRFLTDTKEESIILKAPDSNNYYQAKAEQTPVDTHPIGIAKTGFDPLSDQNNFINILRNCGCEIPEENLKDVLNVLIATDKLKDVFMTIASNKNQQAILDLEQMLNVAERKLQHDWEFNGFQEADDIKFKGFLTWRRILKGAIYFWKKLYQTNALIEIQRAWNAYTQDPNDKILLAGDKDKTSSALKRWQITTESISTIFNTRRPFTRVFYAETKEDAYEAFKKWMADRQLHEDKAKTTIVELTVEGEIMRKEA